jgi:trans-aconitate 2-methyltransferase
MPDWSPTQYLKFSEERTRPCRDLAVRISLDRPRRIVDLGCGPGNSTEVLAERWPDAAFIGLDSSSSMIAKARSAHPHWRWMQGDIAAFAEGGENYDLVFSNAALQWVPDHAAVFPKLLARGRTLAVQMPGDWDGPAHHTMREVASGFHFTREVSEWHTHEIAFYYDALAPHAAGLDLWETVYLHIMDSPEAIVEWYRGSGMRPFLEALPSDADRERFAAAYLAAIRHVYPPRPDGKVIFPFRRMFIVAYRD